MKKSNLVKLVEKLQKRKEENKSKKDVSLGSNEFKDKKGRIVSL